MNRRHFLIGSCSCVAISQASFAGSNVGAQEAPQPKVCTELVIENFDLAFQLAIGETPENDPGMYNRTKAAALIKKKWHKQRRFLNVDFTEQPKYIDTVIEKARLWEPYTGLKFRFGRGQAAAYP